MIEWVKGHEELPQKEETWISKIKTEGNELADEAAKRAAEGPFQEEEGLPRTESLTMARGPTGQRISVQALPKIMMQQFKEARRKALSKPTKEQFLFGQGRRIQGIKRDRTLMFKAAMGGDTAHRLWVMNIGMNRMRTIEFMSRQKHQAQHTPVIQRNLAEYSCPLCQVNREEGWIQTKEHILKGECVAAKKMWQKMTEQVKHELQKAGGRNKWSAGKEKVMQIITEEWRQVQTQEHTGKEDTHIKGAALYGIWTNKAVLRMINILTEENFTEERALSIVEHLSKTNRKGVMKIDEHFMDHNEAYTTRTEEEEIEMIEQLRTGRIGQEEWEESPHGLRRKITHRLKALNVTPPTWCKEGKRNKQNTGEPINKKQRQEEQNDQRTTHGNNAPQFGPTRQPCPGHCPQDRVVRREIPQRYNVRRRGQWICRSKVICFKEPATQFRGKEYYR
jgi:hypothetical protein